MNLQFLESVFAQSLPKKKVKNFVEFSRNIVLLKDVIVSSIYQIEFIKFTLHKTPYLVFPFPYMLKLDVSHANVFPKESTVYLTGLLNHCIILKYAIDSTLTFASFIFYHCDEMCETRY